MADESARMRMLRRSPPVRAESIRPGAGESHAGFAGHDVATVADAMSRADGGTRSRVLSGLQRSHGNAFVQRVAAATGALADDVEVAARIQDASAGGGNRLDAPVRDELEGGLGMDLSSVRVHTDEEADVLSRSVDAKAFTTGSHIFFRAGVFDPSSGEGKRLLAHEAAHVVQQAEGPVAGEPSPSGALQISDPGDAFELAADRAATAVEGHQTREQGGHSIATPVQRIDDDEPTDPNFELDDEPTDPNLELDPPSLYSEEPRIGFGREPGPRPGDPPSLYSEEPRIGFGREPGPGGLSDQPRIGFGREPGPQPGEPPSLYGEEPRIGPGRQPGPQPGEPPSLYGEEPTMGFRPESGAAEAEELDALAEAGAGESLAEGGAAALGAEAILPVAAAGLAGWETGRYLEENTSVGGHAQDTLGAVDQWLSGGPGQPSWMLQTSEHMSENWDQGNYLSAIGEGAELAGAGLAGAVGGLAGGIADAGEAVWDWL